MSKDVIIVGGSAAGLMHGIMLSRLGHKVTILEEQAERQSQAAGIRLYSETIDILQKYAFVPPSVQEGTSTSLYRQNGKHIFSGNRAHKNISWGLLCKVLRDAFDGTGGEGQKKGQYMRGARVSSIREDGEKVIVGYSNVEGGSPKSISGDLVLAADGANSTIRQLLLPQSMRKYSGYVAWRGTVPVDVLDEETNEFFARKTSILLLKRSYLIVYNIPSDEGDNDKSRHINLVWYQNFSTTSPELEAALTDINGKKHQNTVPKGLVNPEVWNTRVQLAAKLMPAPFVEVISKITRPFVTRVNEVISPQASFFSGKVVLVGDALVGLRPNTAMATNQAAMHCAEFEKVMMGDMSQAEWDRKMLRYGEKQLALSVLVSMFGLGSVGQLIKSILAFIGTSIGQAVRR
ncbi:FAD/NAD(P)-binding domain-containing protein [Patellaria atrata CBS 101060]|uniref:FAD/NAD(P)-binding domain-containing protein n=1 Tax=Patellaria atrata CBS 101060 TaxID=1346257 RepID=A0A9P4S1M3_9PEZI|nr:FAD/NAD(P)-binding domain-containing protein [Patellaria atrata CBS 101060]